MREVVAQLLLVGGPVAGGVLALGGGQRRRGAPDRAERTHVAVRFEAEHAADAAERDVRLAIPGAVDREHGRGAEREQVPVRSRWSAAT